MANEQDDAAKAAGDALERALLKATQSVERELVRIVKTGEDDLDRLGRRIAETLAQLAHWRWMACWVGLAGRQPERRPLMEADCLGSTRLQ